MEFAAHCAINMTQNNGRRVTKSDLRGIFSAAFLTIFPGKTQFSRSKGQPLVYLFYIRGEPNGNASVIWMWDSDAQGAYPFPASRIVTSAGAFADSVRPVRYKTNAAPKEIHENLSIQPGEVKMIVLMSFICYQAAAKEIFGFYMVPPSPYGKNAYCSYLFFFSTVVIFTPKSGLFSETAPG
jgi:hypothetical protein